MQTNLPARHETIDLQTPQCPQCGLGLKPFPGTEDSEVLEIEVKAYRRIIHRKRYAPTCQCGCLPGIVCVPAAPKLIAKGKFGISVWTQVLLDKFLYARPSHRLLQEFERHGLPMSAGTLSDGLQTIAPMFAPIKQAFIDKLRSELHWHADETRWAVFLRSTTPPTTGINPDTWLFAYLQACAENDHRAPPDLSSFLPWTMDEARLAAMRAGQPAPVALAEVFDSS